MNGSMALPAVFVALPSLSYALGTPWLGLIVGVVIVPVAEWIGGQRTVSKPIQSVWVLRLLMLGVISQIFILALTAPHLNTLHWFLLALSMGYVSGGTGIVLAHELGHRRTAFDQWLSRLLLVFVAWGPYRMEHNRGHHRHAATWDDPATARAHESLYRFMPRYLRGVYVNGWRLSHHPTARWHEASVLMLLSALLACGLWFLGGAASLGFWVIQAAVAIFLVTAVDYIEHWGLQRQETPNGLERMTAKHIWDCPNGVSEALLFNLPRHAHHHLAPANQGHELQRTPLSPQMPTGYGGMVLLASIPWLWFSVMKPKLKQTQTGLS